MRLHNSELTIFYHCSLNFNRVKQQFEPLKKAGIFLLISTLLCSTVLASQFVGLINAQAGSTITITSEGQIVGTDRIERQGDVYTFTGDIFGIIVVEKDNITIDGAGYTIKGKGNGVDLNRNSKGPSQPGCGGVVVKNVYFCDRGHIFASSNNNSFINNTFEGGGLDIRNGVSIEYIGNVIKHNVFIDCFPSAIFIDWAMPNVVTENNFINSKIDIQIYGQLELDRNYWSNYEALYPDAKEIGDTGIWDTSYDTGPHAGRLLFFDSNPLINHIVSAGAPIAMKNQPLSQRSPQAIKNHNLP